MQREQELADGLQSLVKAYVGRDQVDAHDAELILQYQAQHIREEEGHPTFDEDEMEEWLLTVFTEDDKRDHGQDYY